MSGLNLHLGQIYSQVFSCLHHHHRRTGTMGEGEEFKWTVAPTRILQRGRINRHETTVWTFGLAVKILRMSKTDACTHKRPLSQEEFGSIFPMQWHISTTQGMAKR